MSPEQGDLMSHEKWLRTRDAWPAREELEGGATFIKLRDCHVEEEDFIALEAAKIGSYWDAKPNKEL